MVVIVVIALLLIATVFVNGLLARRPEDTTIVRHMRALERLEQLAREPRPPSEPQPDPEPLSDHIRILESPPSVSASAHRRRHRVRRFGDDDIAPTTVELPALYAEPPPSTDVPAAIGPPPAASRALGRPFQPVRRDPVVALPGVADAVVIVPRGQRHLRPIALGFAAAIAIGALAAGAMFALSAGNRSTPNRVATEPAAASPAPRPSVAPTTTTTPAPSAQLVAAPNGNGTVTVRAPFTVSLNSTSGSCWVNVSTATGQVLFEGTLAPGQQQQFTGSAALVVRLGNRPVMQLSVNGTPLNLSALGNTANVTVGPTSA